MLSKEELRSARLRAMGLATASPATVSGLNESKLLPSSSSSSSSPFSSSVLDDARVWRLLLEGGGAKQEDIERWYRQGFSFAEGVFGCGLRQGEGGPCGVLAAVQAEMIVSLFMDDKQQAAVSWSESGEYEASVAEEALVSAVATILERAAGREGHMCLVENASGSPLPANFSLTAFESKTALKDYLLQRPRVLHSELGCLLLLLSAMLSRGVERIMSDMDEPSHTMIGTFGHCSQETINLLLTGRAVSNVFDGDIPLGDSGLVLKGIQSKARVGYLTQLEASRLCQVGSFYKRPLQCVWVVGSSSHFTVLWSFDAAVNADSKAEELLLRVQAAFKSVDREQFGFIPSSSLNQAE